MWEQREKEVTGIHLHFTEAYITLRQEVAKEDQRRGEQVTSDTLKTSQEALFGHCVALIQTNSEFLNVKRG